MTVHSGGIGSIHRPPSGNGVHFELSIRKRETLENKFTARETDFHVAVD